MNGNRLCFLNLFKFVAALSIAIVLHYYDHLMPFLGMDDPFYENIVLRFLSRYGNVLAELYFVISGLLYVSIYHNQLISKKITFGYFLRRRIIRIFPLLIITSAYMFFANVIVCAITSEYWSCGSVRLLDFISDIICGGKALTGGGFKLNGPIWYIGVLMFLYFISFFLTLLENKYKSIIFYIIPILLGLRWYYVGSYSLCWNSHIARGYVAFFSGVYLGFILCGFENMSGKTKKYITIISMISIISFFLLLVSGYKSYFVKRDHYNPLFVFLVYCPTIIIFYLQNWISKVFDNGFIKYLGDISYHIYLWNFPVLITIHILVKTGTYTGSLNSLSFFAMLVLIHLGIAAVSYAFVDKRLVKALMNDCCEMN